MQKRKSSLTDYQSECNVLGLVTTNQVSHGFKPEPSLNTYPPSSQICDEKRLELVMRNPLILHDNYVTSNQFHHSRKVLPEEYIQPQHLFPASLRRVNCVRPDFHRQVAKGDFDPIPVHHVSETHDAFRAKHRLHDVYGPPSLFITHRDVYLPLNKDVVFHFDLDEPYSVTRISHPYLTTSRMTYRGFSPQEIERNKHWLKVANPANYRWNEIIVGPMEDALEYSVKVHPNLDDRKDYPSDTGNTAGRKWFFRRSLYKGCPVRVFPPVEHYGWSTTTGSTFSHPFSAQDKNNFTSPDKAFYIQPKHSSEAASKIPFMYHTENMGYGSGRNIATQVKVGLNDICGSACVP